MIINKNEKFYIFSIYFIGEFLFNNILYNCPLYFKSEIKNIWYLNYYYYEDSNFLGSRYLINKILEYNDILYYAILLILVFFNF